MPKRPLPLAADVVLNQLQIDAALERYQALHEVYDDAPHRFVGQKIVNHQRQIEEQAGGLLDERDRLIQQRLWWRNELDAAGVG